MSTHFTFPPQLRTVLNNGCTVIWVRHAAQPAITFSLQMPAGKMADPKGLEGLSEVAVALMQKGSRTTTAEQFSAQFEGMGASVFGDAGDEHVTFGCQALSRFFPDVMKLFWEMITQPALDKKEFKRVVREMATGARAELIEPGLVARRHFFAELCGHNHPAGRSHSARSIGRISLRQVHDWYTQSIGPHGATLVIVGDIPDEARRRIWEKQFALWTSGNSAQAEPIVALPEPQTQTIRLIDKKDLSQVSLVMGHPMLGELHPAREMMSVANYIFGGGSFSSRLMSAIRSQQGRTYGISSQISTTRSWGAFMIATSTRTEHAGAVLDLIMREYQRFGKEGITQEELDTARQYAIGSLAFQLEGISNISEKLLWLAQYGRSPEYIEGFADRVTAFTLGDINSAIHEHLSRSAFVIAATGAASGLASEISRFGKIINKNFRDEP